MNRQFTYGSIIQLKDLNQEYKDIYFFIDHVSPTKIKLLSNEGLRQLFLEFDEAGTLLNEDIEEIQIIFQPKEGYAILHDYLPGTTLSITFENGDKLKGRIVDLQEDMITLESETNELFYIDFHYSGIDEEYSIENIYIEEMRTILNKGEEEEEEEDEEFLDIYTMDQQVDDYINKQYRQDKRHTIQKDILYYKQLIEKYTNLKEGVHKILLSNNLFLDSFYRLNESFLYPVSSYIYRHLYDNHENILTNEIQEEGSKHSVLLHDESSYHHYDNAFAPMYQKRQEYHKKVVIKQDTPVICINHQQDDFQDVQTSYVGIPEKKKRGQDSTRQTRTTPYMCEYLEKGQTFIMNGTMIHNKRQIQGYQTIQKGHTLLSKSIQNIHPYYPSFESKKVSIVLQESKNDTHSPSSFFNQQNRIFYPLTEYHTSFKHYIQCMNIRLKDACAFLNLSQGVSMYDILRQLTHMRISEIKSEDFQWIQKEMKKTIDAYKSAISTQKKKSSGVQVQAYQFVTKEELFTLICNHYKDYDFSSAFPSEIIYQSMIDDGMLFFYYLKIKNKDLQIDFENSEIQAQVQQFNEQIQHSQDNDLQDFQKKPIKTYPTLQHMENDTQKVILKDLSDAKGQTNTQYLYHYLVSQFGYSDDLELFSQKLQDLLLHYDPNSSIEQNDDLREKLFGHLKDKSSTIFTNLLSKIIELQIRNGDKCIVLENKKVFVYNNQKWIPLEDQKAIQKKHKMLKVQNATNEFDSLKETILNDYIVDMIDSIQNEKSMDMEKKALLEPLELVRRKTLKSNVWMRSVLKYNMQKMKWIRTFAYIQEERKQLGIIVSPYLSLFQTIMAYPDSSKKYQLIQLFYSLFCIDQSDAYWYHCILSNTKLVPKYMLRLSTAYLSQDKTSYDETIKKICLEEGTLSEQGDLWVHKESGYTIQAIAFDTNYGYDENGFKIKMDALPVQEEDELEEGEINDMEEVVQLTKEEQFQLKREIRLTQVETQLGHLAATFMNTIGISIPLDIKNKVIREMFHILRLGMAKRGKKDYEKMKVYSILGVLLAYVQSNHTYIKKTFPGCIVSFEGYPLEQNPENDGGIIYFACIVEKVSKNVPQMPYRAFHKMTYAEIGEELKQVLQHQVLQNAFVLSMLEQKRGRLQRNSEPTKPIIMEAFHHFKPSLRPIQVKDISHFDHDPFVSKKISNTYEHMMYQIQVTMFINKKIEEFLQNKVSKEKPLMVNKQFKEPFVQNYCCNQSDFILNHLIKSRVDKDQWNQLLEASINGEQMFKSIYTYFVKSQPLNVMKLPHSIKEENVKKIYDDLTLYQFIIHYAHFDDDKPISPFLRELVREKPTSFYDRNDDMETKMKKLKDNGFVYDTSILTQLIQDKAILDEKQLQQQTVEAPNASAVEKTEFQTAFLNIALNQTRESISSMESEIQVLRTQYKSYLVSHMSSFSSEWKRIEELLYSFQKSDNKHGINACIREMIYTMICVIPQLILEKKIQYQDIIMKQWDFAQAHNKNIQDAYTKSYQSFEAIDGTEQINNRLMQINSLKEVFDADLYQSNVVSQHIYLKYMFYKVLCLYQFDDPITMTPSEIQTIRSLNKATIHHLFKMKTFYVVDYSKIKKYAYQTKQGEKMDKTEKLRKMSKQKRRVEKEKMNLKLGEWSYGTNKRVFKYYKDLYDDEDSRANEVKDMMRKMYEHEEEDPHIGFQEQVDVNDDFLPEQHEGPLGVLEDDEYMDPHGNVLDGTEMY